MKLGKFVAGVLVIGACATALTVHAFPTEPIKIVSEFGPGSAPDIIARYISGSMNRNLGQQILIENKVDAAGVAAAMEVAGAPADGHTLLFASVRTWAINPAVERDLKYDPQKSFEAISVAVRTPYVLVVSPNLPMKSVAELIDYMKGNPGKVTFSSSGAGSLDHLTAALFMQVTGTKGVIAPSNSVFAAVNEVVEGRVHATFQGVGPTLAHIEGGKLVAIAVTSEKRIRQQPNLPTFAEGGNKQLVVYSWIAFGAPKGISGEVRTKLADALLATLRNPDAIKATAVSGYEVVANTPDEFSRYLAEEIARWKNVVGNSN